MGETNNGLVTIQRVDPTGNQMEDVRVVLPADIYKYDPAAAMINGGSQGFGQGPSLGPTSPFPNINFSPTIKVFNGGGSDNSKEDDKSTQGGTESLEKMTFASLSNPQKTNLVETTSKPSAAAPIAEKTESKSGGGGMLDFAKSFLIKKLS